MNDRNKPFSAADAEFMRRALVQADHTASSLGEVPIGAVLVHDGEIVSEGCNRNITDCDPTAHAEIVTLRSACTAVGNHRVPPGSTLYVTLEPCVMCAMAMIHARVDRVVYATHDPKTGAAGSVFDTLVSERHNHRIGVAGGLLADQAANMLRDFFQQRRKGDSVNAST